MDGGTQYSMLQVVPIDPPTSAASIRRRRRWARLARAETAVVRLLDGSETSEHVGLCQRIMRSDDGEYWDVSRTSGTA